MSAARLFLALPSCDVHTLHINAGRRPCVCLDERSMIATWFKGRPNSQVVRIQPTKHLDYLSHGSLNSRRRT